MAEYLFRFRMPPDCGWQSSSAGVAAVEGQRASPFAVEAMKELGIDLSPHRSRPVDSRLVETAAWIVVMTVAHKIQLLQMYPEAEDKIFLMHEFGTNPFPRDVPDPIGGSVTVYRRIRDEIDGAMADLILGIREMT